MEILRAQQGASAASVLQFLEYSTAKENMGEAVFVLSYTDDFSMSNAVFEQVAETFEASALYNGPPFRAAQIVRLNKAVHPTTLFITDAAAQGIDLKRVGAVHVMEPSDNVQDERQVINRAVRYRAHAGRAATVRVYRYVCVFPADGRVAPPWKATLYASGMFAKEELAGITRRVQYALLALIADEEEHETIDQRTLRTRARREREIQTVLEQIQAVANEG